MNGTASLRVRFVDGQALTPEDLSAEQDYHVGRLRRHLLGHHTWGIVQGLELELTESSLAVRPGYAIDRLGREILLTRDLHTDLTIEDLRRREAGRITAWLHYHETETSSESAAAEAVKDRIAEVPRLALRDGGAEPSVQGDAPAPDANGDTGLCLGAVRIDPRDGARLQVETAGRIYAGLIGGEVRDPAGRCRVRIGGRAADDRERFAISFDDAQGTSPEQAVFQVRQGSETEVRGRLNVAGPVGLAAPLLFRGEAHDPAALRAAYPDAPWLLYRHSDANGNQLRLAMTPLPESVSERDPEAPGQHTEPLSVGVFSKTKGEILTVSADGTVTVHGDLVVKGLINTRIKPAGSDEPSVAEEAITGTQAAAMITGAAQTAAEQRQKELMEEQKGIVRRFFDRLLAILGLRNPPNEDSR